MQNAQLEPITRNTALRLVNQWKPANVREAAARISQWVRQHMGLINEPVETLHEPVWMLDVITSNGKVWGDCDDAAMLVATIGTALGVPARFVAVKPPGADEFIHVFAELEEPSDGTWTAADPTSSRLAPADWDRMLAYV